MCPGRYARSHSIVASMQADASRELLDHAARYGVVDALRIQQQAQHTTLSAPRAREQVVPIELARGDDAERVVPVARGAFVMGDRLDDHEIFRRGEPQLAAEEGARATAREKF